MKIAILGAGALGCLCYAKLSLANFNPLFIADKRTKASQPPKPSLKFESPSEHYQVPLHFANTATELKHCQLILVTLKAFQVSDALSSLAPWLTNKHIICLMHNGMGVAEQVRQSLPNNPLLLASTAQAALKRKPFHVRHTGVGESYIGLLEPLSAPPALTLAATEAVNQLNAALGMVSFDANIINRLYQKLAINCIINPLTAIYQRNNGALATKEFDKKIQALCDEIATVFTAININTSAQKLQRQVMTVIKATSANYSSMHQDIFYHRKTEIEQITGYLLTLAKQNSLQLPENLALYKKIKQMESK